MATLQQPLNIGGRVLTTSASVGASLYPDHAADAEGLLRAADVALFRAKELGRNRFALYSPALFDAAAQRFRLEQSLRRAVEDGELLLHVPADGIAAHLRDDLLEALLRWRKPDGRIATATEFIHVAEKSGLIHELTEWMLHTAASCGGRVARAGWHRASVAINVSPPQFFESDFVEQVARTLEADRAARRVRSSWRSPRPCFRPGLPRSNHCVSCARWASPWRSMISASATPRSPHSSSYRSPA